MAYLIPSDYETLIQDPTLQQIISGNPALTAIAENRAITEMISYLTQKFNTAREFTQTLIFNPGASYKSNNRVYLDAPAYNSTLTYALNQLCLQNNISLGNGITSYPNGLNTTLYRSDIWMTAGQTPGFNSGQNQYIDPTLIGWTYAVTLIGYGSLQIGVDIQLLFSGGFIWLTGHIIAPNERYSISFTPLVQPNDGLVGMSSGQIYLCNTVISVPESFNPAHWTLLGNQYDIFSVLLPKSEFNLNAYYPKDFQVWWNDHIYTAIIPSIIETHGSALQAGSLENLPYPNVFPDNPINGTAKWEDNGLYTVLGTTLLDQTLWNVGDNRNAQMVEYCIDIVIYKLYKRLSPKDIPKGREDAYSVAIGWLKEASKGTNITANLISIQPPSGQRIRYGGNVKNINTY